MTRRTAAPLGLMLLLAACSGGDRPAPPGTAASAPAAAPDTILSLLDQGDVGAARKLLKAALKREPMNPSLLVLKDSIDRDAKEMLGPDSYGYTVQPGETMTLLAQRLLGNRLKAYQLARYNGIDRPASLAAGQAIRIPGTPPRRADPPRTAEPRAPARSPRPPAATAPARPSAPRPPAPTAAPAANPAAARQARAAGLAALNQGKVNVAVAQLRRAAALDPGNPVIARDLSRAQRIAATVRTRR
ncbi:hypothetical protein ASG29_00705 [Sphingomonas sp. Leaf412]|uniref:LysM peptidoglycan-binding domain-containing protein n=1 Tax=Sphingomonas sp. Leaf412 TaxID=1736370 RepID=UPI0006FB9715|nr:LysM domain-containing protein [Sphingomonas sp. Leaf412]KQT34719.1 hypothetical protein ASG29_00705 [Sphingomonas sp. Leaf412]